MKKIGNNAQNGYVLLILLLSLMAMGGIAIAGYTQAIKREVDTSRYNHNKRVLEQAKQALLMFAYNYPATNGEGPGRLPCPDHDNDGIIDFPLDCDSVGRFPWADSRLNIQETLDANGERLWYAVSDAFDNEGGGILDPNSVGTITLFDQSGNLIYDGAVAGIAAVIIAPGAAQKRDNDGNGTYEFTQLRATAPQQIDPRNYLDTFGDFDNSLFTNGGSNDADGFILGPIYDDNVSDFVVNDQLIIVTTEEVIAMAEQSVLDTYQAAINTYLSNTGGVYPWLDSFVTDNLLTFDADINTIRGRVPSIFANYFDPGNPVDSQAIKPELRLSINIDGQVHNLNIPPPGVEDIFFEDDGDLVSSIDNGFSITRFFWDGHEVTPHVNSPDDDVWEVCPVVTNDEEDCNRDVLGNFKGGVSSDVDLKVRQVTINFAGGNPIVFANGNRTGAVIEYWQSNLENPDPTNHIYIAAQYDNGPGPDYISSFVYDQDNTFLNSFDIQSSGVLIYDAFDTIKVGLPYYPILPDWVLDNDWHHSVQMAIAQDYLPGGPGAPCTLSGCLVVNNLPAVDADNISLLVIAGEVDLVDESADGFFDDLTAQFETENDTFDITYDRRAGNDSVLVIQ